MSAPRAFADIRSRLRRRCSSARDSAGSITPFVLIVTIALLALGGLVVDGGRQLNAKSRAVAYAQEAARAGAQAINLENEVELVDAANASRVIEDYCTVARRNDPRLSVCESRTVSAPDRQGLVESIGVVTEVTTDPILLNMFGRGQMRSSGAAVARPVGGTSEVDSGDVSSQLPPSLGVPGDPGFTTLPPGEVSTPPSEAVPTCVVPTTEKPKDPKDPKDPKSSPTPTPTPPTCFTESTPPVDGDLE